MILTEKLVLDPCCGGRMFYFDKKDDRVLFCDIREIETHLCDGREFSVKPDKVINFADMPFVDNFFNLVVFDPPHLLRNSGSNRCKFAQQYGTLHPTGYQQIKYGALYGDWREMLRKGFNECFRVLKPGHTLIFKWNETDIPVKEILKLTPYQPLFGNRSGKTSKTHWIVFLKSDQLTTQEGGIK